MPDFPKAGTPTDVWAFANRALTAFTGQPRTDVWGENATFEAGVGARKVRIDKALSAIAPTEAPILMTGAEDTLYEIVDIKVAEVEVWLDLTTMAGGDTILLKYYRKVKAAGAYALYASETYTGAQAIPLVKIIGAKIYRDTKVTAQQTAGVNRTLDVQAIVTQEA